MSNNAIGQIGADPRRLGMSCGPRQTAVTMCKTSEVCAELRAPARRGLGALRNVVRPPPNDARTRAKALPKRRQPIRWQEKAVIAQSRCARLCLRSLGPWVKHMALCEASANQHAFTLRISGYPRLCEHTLREPGDPFTSFALSSSSSSSWHMEMVAAIRHVSSLYLWPLPPGMRWSGRPVSMVRCPKLALQRHLPARRRLASAGPGAARLCLRPHV